MELLKKPVSNVGEGIIQLSEAKTQFEKVRRNRFELIENVPEELCSNVTTSSWIGNPHHSLHDVQTEFWSYWSATNVWNSVIRSQSCYHYRSDESRELSGQKITSNVFVFSLGGLSRDWSNDDIQPAHWLRQSYWTGCSRRSEDRREHSSCHGSTSIRTEHLFSLCQSGGERTSLLMIICRIPILYSFDRRRDTKKNKDEVPNFWVHGTFDQLKEEWINNFWRAKRSLPKLINLWSNIESMSEWVTKISSLKEVRHHYWLVGFNNWQFRSGRHDVDIKQKYNDKQFSLHSSLFLSNNNEGLRCLFTSNEKEHFSTETIISSILHFDHQLIHVRHALEMNQWDESSE